MSGPTPWLFFGRLICLGSVVFACRVEACINDSYSAHVSGPLTGNTNGVLAGVLSDSAPPGPSEAVVRSRLAVLQKTPRRDDPDWWNDVAGAYLRLGEPGTAIPLLEEAAVKFPNDYGVHANLGTAYHLVGRYSDAAKEIAADLRINPDGHDGREVYHLALLQYLSASPEWQKQHVFLDEWTEVFWGEATNTGLDESLLKTGIQPLTGGWLPEYRTRLNLASSPAQEQGIAYMATLNPNQPSCFVMLGILALHSKDGYTARLAFNKAISLGSPQVDRLRHWIQVIDDLEHLYDRRKNYAISAGVALLIGLLLVLYRMRRIEAERQAAEVGGELSAQ